MLCYYSNNYDPWLVYHFVSSALVDPEPPRQCATNAPLGIENGTPLSIPDESFTASSVDIIGTLQSTPSSARLNFKGGLQIDGRILIGGWKPIDDETVQSWVQVSLGRDVIVSGVITQGRYDTSGHRQHWVTKFKVMYASIEKTTLEAVSKQGGTP